MHSLMGERLLRQFLGNIRHRKNGDATSEANDGKTADRPEASGPEETPAKTRGRVSTPERKA